jgi:hypothetical protein
MKLEKSGDEKALQINSKKSKPENITKPYRAIEPESNEAK